MSPKWVYVLMAGIIISSLGYSISRFNKRFLFFRKDPLKGQEVQRMDLPRLKNMVIPLEQAQDLSMLNDFLHQHTTAQEPVLMYPEMGAVHFIVDRPYIGRFASATMAWMSPQWHSQWFAQVRQARPRYAVVPKKIPDYFETSYFPVEANRRHFRETMGFIEANYIPVSQTPSWIILQVKEIR
ncbi:MAG: hypothetical protein HY591_07380 [Candidatus Omnitrophica bacterium]|nr:hypothetical protein [Candidatus Omnitrophota bacterium]